jgi:hypothetical protein
MVGWGYTFKKIALVINDLHAQNEECNPTLNLTRQYIDIQIVTYYNSENLKILLVIG